MIIEIGVDNCEKLSQKAGAVLVAYLNYNGTYKKQLTTLIEVSEIFSDSLKIYVTRETSLKAGGNPPAIAGTPTFMLLRDGEEESRLLGEADKGRLIKFIQNNLPECEVLSDFRGGLRMKADHKYA
jgi:hypothetical protein